MTTTPAPPGTKRPRRAGKPDRAGEPVWELAYFYPLQGHWSVEDYLELPGARLIEYNNGFLEVLPRPTMAHQFIALYLYEMLKKFVKANQLGWVLVAPIPVRLGPRLYREPDVFFLSADRPERRAGNYPDGADLVMEIVSGGREDRRRDLVIKREEYAAAGVAEHWIVDPDEAAITVLRLDGDRYVEYGRFTSDMDATSPLLPGFTISVSDVWAAASGT